MHASVCLKDSDFHTKTEDRCIQLQGFVNFLANIIAELNRNPFLASFNHLFSYFLTDGCDATS